MPLSNNAKNGVFLGYPPCCIRAFGDVAVFHSERSSIVQKYTVNGFVPCEDCAEKLAANETTYEEMINPRRKCSVPFAVAHSLDDTRTIDKELSFLTYSL